MKKCAAVLVTLIVLPLLLAAWITPTVTPVCAPDTDTSEFTVLLEGDYGDIRLYRYDVEINGDGVWKTYQGQKGINKLLISPQVEKIAVRWTGDHQRVGYAVANNDLCATPTRTPGLTPPPPTVTPTMTATPTPTPTPTIVATVDAVPTNTGIELVTVTPTVPSSSTAEPTLEPTATILPPTITPTSTPSKTLNLSPVLEPGSNLEPLFLPSVQK